MSNKPTRIHISKDLVLSVDMEMEDFENGKLKTMHETYQLRPITIEQLLELREKGLPAFIYKRGDALYFAIIPDYIRFLNCKHLCSSCQRVLHFSDKETGCPKIADRTSPFAIQKYLLESKRIEKYDFIRAGFESIFTHVDSFIVTKCDNFVPVPTEGFKSNVK